MALGKTSISKVITVLRVFYACPSSRCCTQNHKYFSFCAKGKVITRINSLYCLRTLNVVCITFYANPMCKCWDIKWDKYIFSLFMCVYQHVGGWTISQKSRNVVLEEMSADHHSWIVGLIINSFIKNICIQSSANASCSFWEIKILLVLSTLHTWLNAV